MGRAEADHELVQNLFKLQKKHGKLVRSSVYDAPEDPEVKVRSWKMSEHHYYKVPSPFPTLARGIFSTWVPNGSSKEEGQGTGNYRIVARGYDKFFNIGEVPWTTWDAITQHTSPPYTLTVKSNGCIIFVGALTPSKLLVTSKHSIGPIQGQEVSHSQAGDKWISKHLESVGKQRSELAKVLWDNGWTAVAELCDDSFEEHVLPYDAENTGLHLHGINRSTADFETLPSSSFDSGVSVESFAKEWGFIPTKSFDLESAQKVKEFTDSCGLSGSWNGEPLEGFVVRAHLNWESDSKKRSSGKSDRPPYPPGTSFFFKVKFDEPYMMYRDWREITRTYLSAFSKDGAVALRDSKASKQRLKRAETRLYDYWVRTAIVDQGKLFSGYQHSHGIIASRQEFLKWMASPEGQSRLAKEKGERPRSLGPDQHPKTKGKGKTIIVPVAIPGCGKTSVAIALARLFGFGHTQSDDVITKAAPIFESNVRDLLQGNAFDVVIADKNNHLRQHRMALRHLLPNANPPIRLIALHWLSPEVSKSDLHRICATRITTRGDNHQTLRASSDASSPHEEILWRFINTSEDLTDPEVDDIIEMDIRDDTDSAVRRAVSGLCKVLGLDHPSEDAIRDATNLSQAYTVPSTSKRAMNLPAGTKIRDTKKGNPRYFGITPTANTDWQLNTIINSKLSSLSDNDEHGQLLQLWKTLTDGRRVTEQPHITLVHQTSLKSGSEKGAKRLWQACSASDRDASVKFRLSHLIYNSRIMALVAEPASFSESASPQFSEILKAMDSSTLERLHITVGTADSSVKPVEAGELVLKWRQQKLKPGEGGVIPLSNNDLLSGNVQGLWS